jgi:EmrB/QacA subfamily drug resistance transporter
MHHQFAEPDEQHKWPVMIAVSMGVFLATIDGSIVNIAMPTLERALNTDLPTVQWVVLSYLLVVATLLLSVGRLADMVGKKPVYLLGIVVFTLSSALCGLSPTVYWLIGFRVLQAIGAAMIMALGPAIVTEAFPARERGKVLGIVGSTVSVGIVMGPALGGIIIDHFSWHWIFFVNIPVGVLGIILSRQFIPSIRPPGGQRFDYPGAVTLFIGLVCLLLAPTLGQRIGFTSPPILGLVAVATVFLLLFLLIEWKTPQPMVHLQVFQQGMMGLNLVMGLISFITASGTIFLLPYHLENVRGYETGQAGLLMAVVPVMMGLTAPIAGALSDRVGTRVMTTLGLLVMAVSYYGMTTISDQTPTLGYVLLFLPIGVGAGIFQSPNNSAIMGAAPRSQLGVVSGLLAISRVLGQTTGTALMVALWASRVFVHLGDRLAGGATEAPAAAQVAGLHETFLVMAGLMGVAVLLSVWGLVREHYRLRLAPQS